MAARLASAIGWIFMLSAIPAHAATSDSLAITIGIRDTWPPAPVTGLAAVSGAEGQALLQWTAPDSSLNLYTPRSPASSYIVHMATFSVDSLSGDTTAWWNIAQDVTGEPLPSAPGNSDSMLFNALIPGASYFFAIKSVDNVNLTSLIDVNAAAPGQQASVLVTDLAPDTPKNLIAVNGDAKVLLIWTELTTSEKTLDFDHYRLERSIDGTHFISITTTTAISYLDMGLTNNQTYIYRVIAVDKGAPGPALESAPSATAGAIPQATLLPPATVAGLSGKMSDDAKYFTVNWATVTTNADGTPLHDLALYSVLKSTGLFAPAMATFIIPMSQTWFTDMVNGGAFYYKVRAVDINGNESQDSNFVVSMTTPPVIASGDDGKSYATVRSEISAELHKENNASGSDLVLAATHLEEEETGNVLKSYLFEVRRAENNETVSNFSFSRPMMNVTMGFATGAGTLAQSNKRLSVYWDNGMRFVSLGGDVNFAEGTISVLSSNPGRYQLRLLKGAGGVLTDGSPYPRVITPDGDGVNDRAFFFFETTDASVEGKIYDLNSAFVAGMKPGPVQDASLIWDGKDSSGRVVPMGVYLYKVSIGKESVTGTLVVAR